METKSARIAVILPERLRDKYKELCEDELRSMSNKTAELIAEYVNQRQQEKNRDVIR